MMERLYFRHKGIQISFIDDMTGAFYQNKQEASHTSMGLYCYVNNIPLPWFHRYPAGTKQIATSVMVTERFLIDNNLSLPYDGWDRLARALNRGNIFIPSLAIACREIKNSSISGDAFEIYFRGKVTEALGLLIDYMQEIESSEFPNTHKKSRLAAKNAIQILNENFVHPPLIDELAQSVGIGKTALQTSFLQLTGLSVHDYIRSLRLSKALTLMEDRALRIEDISKAVGYQSKIHFFRAFDKVFDCKPNEVRKQILE